jgi:hypothetical protein
MYLDKFILEGLVGLVGSNIILLEYDKILLVCLEN